MTAALIALALATLADIITTIIALQRGFVEAAPVMRWIMSWAGSAWWVVKIVFTVVGAWVLVRFIGDPVAVWAFAAGIGLVALWNLRLLVKG
ncbi:hypothetical protein SAMN04490244_101243 [Tranquillimonas rosea]|uniref:DUF5658 domain-containing protein n=1 Tax=Tranquillimonas rosea TaxID=641238 RepID=A0A1H9PLG9_9RHOB|nr:DUF5658 family protein [Tranquillimonas rosea]SER49062.1 hypothetical protein SAMN04490244_101243 [Tranquillimonas rosea]